MEILEFSMVISVTSEVISGYFGESCYPLESFTFICYLSAFQQDTMADKRYSRTYSSTYLYGHMVKVSYQRLKSYKTMQRYAR